MAIQQSQITQVTQVSENYFTKQTTPTQADIQNWLVSYITELLIIEANEIDVTIPFDRYGLDSATAIGLTGDLEDWLAIELDPTLIYDYPSIEALAVHLTEQFKAKDSN